VYAMLHPRGAVAGWTAAAVKAVKAG